MSLLVYNLMRTVLSPQQAAEVGSRAPVGVRPAPARNGGA